MEFLMIMITVVVFIFIMISVADFGGKPKPDSYANHSRSDFNIYATKKKEKLSDENPSYFDFIKVFIDGVIKVPYDGYTPSISVMIFDTTSGKEEPILCTLDSMQFEKSLIFHYSRDMKMPYKGTIINKVEFIRIPTMFLQFPKSGRRMVKVIVEILDYNGRVLTSATDTIYHISEEEGYLEALENKEKFDENIVKTAVLAGSIDGYLNFAEEMVIEKWIEKESYSSDIVKAMEKENKLKEFLEEGKYEVESLGYSMVNYLAYIDDWATEAQKYEIYELCLKVASADGVAAAEELEFLKKLAEYMDLDPSKYQAMTEKELPITMHEKSTITPEEMIGITSDMTKQEIKKHLMGEYRKWNARVGNSDSKIREQAEEMTMLIAELRKKYR